MRLFGSLAASATLAIAGCTSLPTSESGAQASAGGFALQCKSVDASMLGASSAEAHWVAADVAADLPAHCEVNAILSPVEGSEIGVRYRLPEDWNGRILGSGGGGFAGRLTMEFVGDGLKAGYAIAQTDGGHPQTDVWYNEWATDPIAVDDFAWRAVHEMTVTGKRLVAFFYGRPHERAYFDGCSTGGRQAMVEAQRFPHDYDALIGGAPTYTLQVQTSAILRSLNFSRPGASFTNDELTLVNRSVIAACDADDGLADGIINAPRSCGWDPAGLVCKPGDAAKSCISESQADALRTAYAGIRAPDGDWAMMPLSKGGEIGWSRFIGTDGRPLDKNVTGGILTLGEALLGNADFDFAHFGPADAMNARKSEFARNYEAKNPDLSEFIAAGGKLILWHGEADQAPSPAATEDYLAKAYAANPQARDHLRYFSLPGVPHCRGGDGADKIDIFAALDDWVDSGIAPDSLVATGSVSGVTRKACAWPKVARYRGFGEPNNPDSWECAERIP